jgi:hypothetical protein
MGEKGSPLERAAGVAGPHTVEALKLLTDETRLAILLALWEAYDPKEGDGTLAFTELFEAVGAPDSGNFAYHLGRLVPRFVQDLPEGYRLSNTGHRIVRAVIAGTGITAPSLPPTEVPRSCDTCGAPVQITYRDQRLLQVCSACGGHIGPGSPLRTPPGTLVVHDGFDPAGLVDRTPEEVFVAGTIEYMLACSLVIRGVCPECSGSIEASLRICEDHDAASSDLCSASGTCDAARVGYVCSVCKFDVSYPVWVAAFNHPDIVAFYHDHGIGGTYAIDDPAAAGRAWARLYRTQELVSTDPVRIRVRIQDARERLTLTLDEELDVVDITGPQPTEELPASA